MKSNIVTPMFLLLPSQSQKAEVRATLSSFNRGSQFVLDLAIERDMLNKVQIQPLVYDTLRKEFQLPSQMAVRVISNGVELAKAYVRSYSPRWRIRANRVSRRPSGAPTPVADDAPILLDDLLVSFPNPFYASVRTLSGREKIPMRYCRYAARQDTWPFTLLIPDQEIEGIFWLHLPPSGAQPYKRGSAEGQK